MRIRITAVVALLILGCAKAPYVNSIYVGPEPITSRPATAPVEVFLTSQSVEREYVILADVEVSSLQANRTAANMHIYAKKRARSLGADALIEVSFGTWGASRTPNTFTNNQGRTVTVTNTTVLRALTAKAVRWK